MVKGFTAKDKVIVHLLKYYDKQDRYPQPAEITQEGIADFIESKQNTVSYAVRNLVKDDILHEKTTRVEGKKQRRKGYFLTDKGVEKARKKKRDMEHTRITLDMDGDEKEVLLREVNKYLHTNLSVIEIMNKLKDGRFEHSIKGEEIDCTSFLVDMPKAKSYEMEGTKLLERWWEDSKNNILYLKGKCLETKTSVLSSFIENMQDRANLFYFKLDDWQTPRYLIQQLADFLSEGGQHRLSSYLEASINLDKIEIFTNFQKDISSIYTSLMVLDGVPKDDELLDIIEKISEIIQEHSDIKLILTARDDIEEIFPQLEQVNIDEEIESGFFDKLSQHFGIIQKNDFIIDEVLKTRLTSEEYLTLSYISIFRRPVEKSEILRFEPVNELILKNLMQTPLLTQTLDGKPILPEVLKERLQDFIGYEDHRWLHKKASDYYCGLPVKNPFESIECAYHTAQTGQYGKFVKELKIIGEDILKSGFSSSLLQVLESINEDDLIEEEKAIIDYYIGESYRTQSNFKKAEDRIQSLLDRTKDNIMLAKAHESLGLIRAQQGQYTNAIQEYKKAESYLEGLSDEREPILGRLYFKIAKLYSDQGKYIDAKEFLEKSRKILEKKNSHSLLTSTYFLLARLEKGRGKWEEALQYFKKGVDSWKKINESYQRVGGLHDIGSFYKGIRELSNAEKFLNETIETCEKFGYRYLKAQALLTLSECYLEKEEYEKAIESAEEADDIFGSLGKEEEQGYAHALFGQIYIKLDMDDKAEDHLSRAISIYQKLGSSYSLGLAYFSMAKLQEKKENPQGIADNYRKALVSINSSGADEMAQEIKREMKTVPLSM